MSQKSIASFFLGSRLQRRLREGRRVLDWKTAPKQRRTQQQRAATPMTVLRRVKMRSSRTLWRIVARRTPKMAPTQGAAAQAQHQQLKPTPAHFLLMQKVCLRSGKLQ